MMKHWIISFLVSLTLGTAALAQQREADIKFRLAQSYERSNDWENALKLYEELYAKDSTNVVLFESLRRGYLQLKRYEDAIQLIHTQLRFRPNDVSLYSHLGVVHARMGETDKAQSAWNRAIAVDKRNPNTYRVVANAALENRLFEQAIATYQRGRSECGDQFLFVVDLAHLYAVTMNFSDATKEYLTFLRQNPAQLAFVQSRMSSYVGRPEGLTAAIAVVENALRSDRTNIPLSQLLAWLYMEGKLFDKAFSTTILIDQLSNAGGRELYAFAERALKDKALQIAARAFKTIIERYPSFDGMPVAKLGYARTLEEMVTADEQHALFLSSDFLIRGPWGDRFAATELSASETQSKFAAANNSYAEVVREYPGTEIAARSLERIAIIQLDRLFDVDSAIATLERLTHEYARFVYLVVSSNLLLGDALLIKGTIEAAEKRYQFVAEHRMADQDSRDRAQYRLAEIDFFRGAFREAQTRLERLTKDPTSNAANDALTLHILIHENASADEAALREFAAASLLVRQRRLPEAIVVLENIEKRFARASLVDETLMLLGDVLIQMKKYGEGIAAYERLIAQFPESIVLDRAHMKIGYVYQTRLHDPAKATASYQLLLEKYPHSIYATEARKRIREMRGDNI